MRKRSDNLILLNVLFAASLIVANVVAGKIIMLFGFFVLPAAVVSYAFTFLITDVIGELWGKEEAQKTVKKGLVAQVFASLLILVAQHLPVAPFAADMQNSFNALLGQNWRFALASLTAYYVSQTNDVYIFHKLKAKHGDKYKWIRNNLSTMTSQFIDTGIFITVAFWGTVPNIWVMILSQYFIKLCLAAMDTPFFYLLTRKKVVYE